VVRRLAGWARSYPEVLAVLVVAGLAVAFPGPGRWLADHHGVDVALAALVAVTALAIPAGSAAALKRSRTRLALALAVAAVALPVLGWVASRLVVDAVLRRGVLALGVAPAEVASVATVGLADGDTASAAGLLIGSTLITVVLAGPVLSLLGGAGSGGHGSVDVGSVLANLVVVVGLPLLLGLALRRGLPASAGRDRVQEVAPVVLVTILVGLVASEVVVTRAYVGVLGALVVFLVGSTALGAALGRGAVAGMSRATLLTTGMRDFAIAAGIATAAFGVRSAGPLGLYGVLVIVWGLAIAGYLRRRQGLPSSS
jgi:predicted Na+-dependent transporter